MPEIANVKWKIFGNSKSDKFWNDITTKSKISKYFIYLQSILFTKYIWMWNMIRNCLHFRKNRQILYYKNSTNQTFGTDSYKFGRNLIILLIKIILFLHQNLFFALFKCLFLFICQVIYKIRSKMILYLKLGISRTAQV